jgi:hypothetical protein
MLDFHTSAEVESNFRRIDAILGCGIFSPQGAKSPLYLSALTELMIRLHDTLGKASAAGCPIDFVDDVMVRGDVVGVRSLVAFIRNAVCHISSGNHKHDEADARISFSTCHGKCCLAEINGVRIEGEYPDDVAFFFGPQRLYLVRHVVRAYKEARSALELRLWRHRAEA